MGKSAPGTAPREPGTTDDAVLYRASVSWRFLDDEEDLERPVRGYESEFLDNMSLEEQLDTLESLRERKAGAACPGLEHGLIGFLEMMIKENMRGRMKVAVVEASLGHRVEAALSTNDAPARARHAADGARTIAAHG